MNYLETDTAIANEDVEFHECRAVKLHYLIYGRNAWNTTWVTKYSPGCMNPTFDSAKAEAEKKRVQGSVFYIREVPALQFISKKLCIFITEINTDSPLKNFLEVSEQPNITLMDVYSHFTSERPNSIIRLIWRNTEFSRQNGKMCLVRNNFNSLETIASSRELKGYKSYSNGKGYYLGWNKEENKLHTSSVERLAADYDRKRSLRGRC